MNGPGFRRRGACPSLPQPMPTGDGLLARLPPAGALTLDQFTGLARLAGELGNGVLEVTARGKLQLRGLTAEGAAQLPRAVAALGLDLAAGFPVETSALAGLDPAERADPRPLARTIAGRAAALMPRLAPKVSVVVDGRGALHAGALKADIALVADPAGGWRVVVAGMVAGRAADEGTAADVAFRLLERLAGRGPGARMADLLVEEADALGLGPTPPDTGDARPAEAVGRHALRDGTLALGLGLRFGQVRGEAAEALAAAARAEGVRHVELAAGRALLLVGLAPAAGDRLARRATALGLIADSDDPRRRVFACAGRPACASARIETHALATTLAAALTPLMQGGTLHVSGCAKGCAHPARATLTIVGLDAGAGLVVEGTPRDAPAGIVPVAALPAAVATWQAETGREGEPAEGGRAKKDGG